MKKNIGPTDRLLRLTFAILLLAFAWWQHSWIALAASLFTFYEAAFSWCIFYQLIGKNSCPVNLQTTPNEELSTQNHLRLDPNRLGLAGAIVWGLSIVFCTTISIFTGYGHIWLGIVKDVYPGYDITWTGAVIGFFYCFIDAYIFLYLIAWIYNKVK